MHHADHAGDVKHRDHAQRHAIGRGRAPHAAGHGVVHQGAMWMHAALGQARGAAGVGQHRKIVWPRRVLGGGLTARERITPGVHLAPLQRWQRPRGAQPILPRRGHVTGLQRRRVEGIGVLTHQQVREPLVLRQQIAGPRHFVRHVAGGDRHARIRILDVMHELLRAVHRIDGDDHGVGAQDGEMRNHPLRTVLHVKQHAITLAHAPRGQLRREALGFVVQPAVAGFAPHEHQRRLARIAPGIDNHVEPQRGIGNRDGVGQARRPERVVDLHAELPWRDSLVVIRPA